MNGDPQERATKGTCHDWLQRRHALSPNLSKKKHATRTRRGGCCVRTCTRPYECQETYKSSDRREKLRLHCLPFSETAPDKDGIVSDFVGYLVSEACEGGG